MADPRHVLLDLINNLRQKHHAPGFRLDEQHCKEAQRWAENLAETGDFKIANGKLQLIFNCTSSTGTIDDAVQGAFKSWEMSKSNYDFNNPSPTSFSLLVWKETKESGIGVAKKGDKTYVVLQVPSGNMRGAFEQNVLKA